MKFLCAGLIATPLSLVLVAFGVGAGTPAAAAATQLAASCARSASDVVVADGASVRLSVPADGPLLDDSLSSRIACLTAAAGTPSDGSGQALLGQFSNWTVTADEDGHPVFTSTLAG